MESAPAQIDSLTPSQRRAVLARGNVLVMAGAGTGKTKTLVERCLDCLDRERVALDELLIVTFTEAAAAEMRVRLRRELEKKSVAAPDDEHWPHQLALFDVAHIGTLHSFCLRLIREHFYELGLDPQLTILDEGEARQRASETLEEQFQAHYAGEDDFSRAVQNLIQIHGGGRDEKIRALILRLHNYSQTRPDAAGWLDAQAKNFSSSDPTDWERWLLVAIADWRDDWLPVLEQLQNGNEKAGQLIKLLARLPKDFSRPAAAAILEEIAVADLTASYPKGKAGKLRPPLGSIFNEAKFLVSLAALKAGSDPLAEDWSWVRGHMATLLRLAQQFAAQFAESKRRDGVLDFHDLEQFALKLLWDFPNRQPTAVAEDWRQKLHFVFVDEYQDINAAQDKIIAALAREDGGGETPGEPLPESSDGSQGRSPHRANRFLVGDVKQSIYRFRLADPKIFRDYAHSWHGTAGETIPLSENFRSCEGLLNFVNAVCRLVMREQIGGVTYDTDAELKPGRRWGEAPGEPKLGGDDDSGTAREDARPTGADPRVELWLRRKAGRNEMRDEGDDELADLDEAQKEARLVALRLKQLIANRHEIWDEHAKSLRPAEWRDIAILLRSPRGKSEIFAKEFELAGVPLAVARGGFYKSAEILDLLSLLQLLDNPLQDVPCIAVLRSPLVGLSLDELAEIRLALRDGHFWTALNAIQNEKLKIKSELRAKAAKFLERFSRWRKLAKQASLSECLEAVLAETLYADWLRAQPRGAQRAANVAGFLNLAQQFDQFQRQGLFRFLKFIEAEQAAEVEPEVSAAASENAVRLMSIHQSKGLEFPVVVLADLAKSFNEQDLRGEIIFDEKFGLCPKVKPPSSGRRYPSLPHWLAQRRQKRELRGEELRLLYVALTRARDNLILTASISEKSWDEVWTQPATVNTQQIAGANSFAAWLALWFAQNVTTANATQGETPLLRWRLLDDEALANGWGETPGEPSPVAGDDGSRGRSPHQPLDEAGTEKLRAILEWGYPFAAATVRKAKSSVTALRREAEELDDEAETLFPIKRSAPAQRRKVESGLPRQSGATAGKRKLSASEIGAAHHTFLQHVTLAATNDLTAEADRLARENYLSADERAALDLKALAAFWHSELGREICAHAALVRRELPFTAKFSPTELAKIIGQPTTAGLENEFVVVQGVADLLVLQPEEIWLVDFKTDAVDEAGLPEKLKTYAPQLKLYSAALEKIFNRNVTRRALHFLALQRTEPV